MTDLFVVVGFAFFVGIASLFTTKEDGKFQWKWPVRLFIGSLIFGGIIVFLANSYDHLW